MPTLAMAMTPARAADVCDDETRALLEERFEVRWAGDQLDQAEVARLADGAEIMITSWGTPSLPADLLGETGPRIVAHAAGTVKRLVPSALVGDRLTVFSAATRIAWSVGEYCLAACLTLHRRLPSYDARTRAGGWKPTDFRGRELRGRTVALIGGSSTARAFRSLLEPFGARVLVYDPYLDQERARELDVTLVGLPAAMNADVVSIHVPDLPATKGMITADLLARIPDGSVLINSARAGAVDPVALEREALSGRLRIALDVYDPEPAQLSPELLASPDVLLTPHIAGDSLEGHLALVRYVVDDVIAFLADGSHGPSWVDPQRWSLLA
ncbi:hydroxyacid dehydrogenase [Microlunatus sp. GCM10028923]|uniref:hydroxyacid dehydrogenase n=1 Tax=Microlunatus sp. GCM10028923 TaxID=3273400 RepID=UPI003615ACFF